MTGSLNVRKFLEELNIFPTGDEASSTLLATPVFYIAMMKAFTPQNRKSQSALFSKFPIIIAIFEMTEVGCGTIYGTFAHCNPQNLNILLLALQLTCLVFDRCWRKISSK